MCRVEQTLGVVNGALGTVEDVVWDQGARRCDLPLAVLVSLPDYSYRHLEGQRLERAILKRF